MDNPRKFNIVNPKHGSCEAHYEGVRLPPMWRRCLRYRPRVKDFRVLMLPVDRIHGMRRSVGRLWSPTPSDVHSKHPVSSSDTRTGSRISTKSIKVAQTRGPEKDIAQDSVSPIKPTLTEPFDQFPLSAPIKESKSDEARELSIGTALSSGYDTHGEPRSSLTSPYPNRHNCIASTTPRTTPRTTLNFSRPQRYIQDGDFQEKGNNAALDNSRSDDTSSWEILQVNKHIRTSRQEQEEIVESRCLGWQESRTPRNSRRCGQVWDSEETRAIFLEIALTQGQVTRLT
ncbi:hypothetical protein DSL72_005273 [Monilinia vaccinii-corymbosi]|uniref:Uncharacterized protein n=1 Tax=Monilinia vaccinii-corymbosi TaxID=61207 RepID=A0A8A3PEQ4_9HELO|nr:hypothetical protein DSL72_005273 [Monilinia vaccinii-corymbosi]